MDSVLLVCMGNLCRSPMAQALLGRAMPELRLASAGLSARSGMPADPYAIQLMAERGLSLSAHRSQPLRAGLCARSGLVLCMSHEQKRMIELHNPRTSGKVFVLGHSAIPDPYGRGLDAFVESMHQIESELHEWLPKLRVLMSRAEVVGP
ncbi:low molecular weight protein-tyrosine-phosphatase [Dyella sp. OK004]|uniref:low molecular weight protein-tyrosine-phosphatase n=1 Tax=Dyella sp. OK004 TaxID=1855292 RepID=UPI0015A4F970|nr:low molecular weight protein-tyrosine-phosphatase [Dyella sp. OK004]